jgi:hypothetical protein
MIMPCDLGLFWKVTRVAIGKNGRKFRDSVRVSAEEGDKNGGLSPAFC